MDASPAPSYRGYRFPAEIISDCVWLYFRFCLSFRDVQEMMLERGLIASHEAIRDKLSSYTTAHRELISELEHRRGRSLNNRAENSHRPIRERERRMRRFKSMKLAQRFLSTHGQVSNHFRCGRHLMRACHYRNKMVKQFETRRAICGLDQPTIVDHRLISP